MSTRLLWILLIALSLTACSVHYVEKETPPGHVPPATTKPSDSDTYRDADPAPLAHDQRAAVSNRQKYDALVQTIERFRIAYKSQGSPRIAFFFNRELSDIVRKWQGKSRTELYDSGVTIRNSENETTKRSVTVTDLAPHREEGRKSPEETWMWAFEEGVVGPFIDAGANIVDRATIMRLTAADSSTDGIGEKPDTKTIETRALINYADIFVEILVKQSSESPFGYVFKAVAKSVKDGSVLASANSLRWLAMYQDDKQFIATEAGYDYRDSGLPPVQILATDIAVDLMEALIRHW